MHKIDLIFVYSEPRLCRFTFSPFDILHVFIVILILENEYSVYGKRKTKKASFKGKIGIFYLHTFHIDLQFIWNKFRSSADATLSSRNKAHFMPRHWFTIFTYRLKKCYSACALAIAYVGAWNFINIKRWTILNWRSIRATASMSLDKYHAVNFLPFYLWNFWNLYYTYARIVHNIRRTSYLCLTFLLPVHMLVHLSQVGNNGVNCIATIFLFRRLLWANASLCVVAFFSSPSVVTSTTASTMAFHLMRYNVCVSRKRASSFLLAPLWK